MPARSLLCEAPGLALCTGAFLGAEALGRRVPLPLPPGIVGALFVTALLLIRPARAPRLDLMAVVAPGGDRLLRHLGVLFVPAAVLALRQRAVLVPALLPLAILVGASTTVGLVVAGLLTEWLARGDGAQGSDTAAAREEGPGT
jgi:putative effector of murein hydrolase LrgA (UPF0299 family)